MSAALSMRRERSAKLVFCSDLKALTASWSFCSICAAERGSNVFITSPVEGLVVAMGIASYLSSQMTQQHHDTSLIATLLHGEACRFSVYLAYIHGGSR